MLASGCAGGWQVARYSLDNFNEVRTRGTARAVPRVHACRARPPPIRREFVRGGSVRGLRRARVRMRSEVASDLQATSDGCHIFHVLLNYCTTYRGDKDKKWTFLGRMDYSSTRRLLILRPVSF